MGNLGGELGIKYTEQGIDFAECEVEFERDGRDGGANTGGVSGHPIPLCKGAGVRKLPNLGIVTALSH